MYYIIILFFILFILLRKKQEPFSNYDLPLSLVPRIMKESAQKLNIPFKINNRKSITLFNNHKDITFRNYINSINSKDGINLSKNKFKCSLHLKDNNIPVPNPQLVNNLNKNNINDVINNIKINFPLVIKPVEGTGGKYVFVNIKSKEKCKEILNIFLDRKINNILIEEYIQGKDYRILCYKDNVLDVIERVPPFVEGDGINNIKDLVHDKNKKNNITNRGFHSIKINKQYLDENGYDENTILEKNKKLVVNPASNFHNGGYPKRVPLDSIHPDNISMFSRINKLLNLNLSGIDCLIPDITKSHKEVGGAINEVNKFPNFDIHYYADNKKSLDTAIDFLKLYFN